MVIGASVRVRNLIEVETPAAKNAEPGAIRIQGSKPSVVNRASESR